MHSHIHEISDSTTPIIEVRHESVVALTEYARIAIAFEVNEVFDVATSLESQFTLTPRQLPVPLEPTRPGCRPITLPRRASYGHVGGQTNLADEETVNEL